MRMEFEMIYGVLLPFVGTSLGAACVFVTKKSFCISVQRMLNGFAAGVMVAASVWSLLIPALEQAEDMGKGALLPSLAGLWIGILFLQLLNRKLPQDCISRKNEEEKSDKKKDNACSCGDSAQYSGRNGCRCSFCRLS